MQLRPIVLVILDGWGVAPHSRANAISQAKTPHFDEFLHAYPAVTLQASGEAVGLPWGEPGNSEVGHLGIGSGKIVYQDFPLITKSIRDGTFFENAAFLGAVNHARTNNSSLHIAGLLSSGGVHSFHEHLYSLLEFCRRENFDRVYIHAFLDGRDVAFNSGVDFLAKLQAKIEEIGVGRVATVIGRFWAMDRDHHWDRIQQAYDAMVEGKAEHFGGDPITAVRACYGEAVYDEEVPPIVIQEKGHPLAQIKDNDALILFNFRPDRARELTGALSVPDFIGFERKIFPKNLFVTTMTEYDASFPVHVAFPKERVTRPLAKIVSDAGLKQLHVAETEKYAHVTYFLNGGTEAPFPGEDHILIPSRSVISHATHPEMSAKEITDAVVKAILGEQYDFIAVNFANADMVAHTGDEAATISAIEYLDSRLGEISDAVLAKNGLLIVTSDHGNAEVLLNVQTGEIDKEHNTSPVPFLAIATALHGKSAGGQDPVGGDLSLLQPAGVLADVAPTLLKFMELPIPEDMTGRSLL